MIAVEIEYPHGERFSNISGQFVVEFDHPHSKRK